MKPTCIRRVIQEVDYCLHRLEDGTELYLTAYGQALEPWLKPQNWFAPEWFRQHRQRLRGSSAVYRVTTRPVHGRSIDLIVRYSRVGEAIPLDTVSNEHFLNAEFNSPFEEFARVKQLRSASLPNGRRILTKRPLAILVPPRRLRSWQTGRSAERLAVKQARSPEVTIDIERQYVLVYGWIKGCDAEQAAARLGLDGAGRESFLNSVLAAAEEDLAQAGFRVLDMKAEHVIVRLNPDGSLLRRRDGHVACAVVDYELLEPVSESTV